MFHRFPGFKRYHLVVQFDLDGFAFDDLKVMPSFSMDTPMRRSRKFRRNAYFSQSFGMAGERKSVFLQAHAGKTVDDRHPGAAHVGHVQAVLRVAVRVVQVQACCLDEILIRLVHIPDLRGHDAEDAGGQRRIMRRDAFIVVIRTLNRFQALLVFQQEVGEHRIRLFAHLVTVNGERMVVQQQRIFVLRRVLEIPYRFAEERIVLRVNAECFIIQGAAWRPPLSPKPKFQPWLRQAGHTGI